MLRQLWSALRAQQPALAIYLPTIMCLVAMAVVHWTVDPRETVYYVYDASIAYEMKPNTIPDWAAVVPNALAVVLAICVIEFWALRSGHSSATGALAVSIHFFLYCSAAVLVTLTVSEITKIVGGKLRPDWLVRCQPDFDGDLNDVTVGWGRDEPQFPCTNSDHEVDDGRKSLPSGHAATSACIGASAAVYLLHASCMRSSPPPSGPVPLSGSTGAAFKGDLGRAVAFFYGLLILGYAWLVGVSRFVDNRHTVEDVVAGWLLGLVIGGLFAAKMVTVAWRVEALVDADHAKRAASGADGREGHAATSCASDERCSVPLDVESGA